MAVRKDVYEERQNQLRWQSKVGDDQISLQQKHDILDSREAAWKDYKVIKKVTIPVPCRRRSCAHAL